MLIAASFKWSVLNRRYGAAFWPVVGLGSGIAGWDVAMKRYVVRSLKNLCNWPTTSSRTWTAAQSAE